MLRYRKLMKQPLFSVAFRASFGYNLPVPFLILSKKGGSS